MKIQELKQIVFEKQKVPYYIRQHGETKIATVVDKEGLHTYVVMPDQMLHKGLIPFNEIKEEDLIVLEEAIGRKTINELLSQG